ncbi:MAG TPA: anti-sigma factor [Bryobacteraceae bacterium]|nr:anti-sigma factor [Bryobacteraceae bacterium]
MNCSELRDHYELYVLGVADEPERSEIRTHLDRGCEVCTAEMKRAREFAALLGGTAMPAEPSPKLRRRILASVGAEERRFGWAPFLAAATVLSLCAAVYFIGRERDFAQEASILRDQSRRQTIELTRLSEAFAILNGAETTVTSFGESQPKPKGKVFCNPALGVLLIASNLPQAPAGKAYEMWVISRSGQAVRAGMFQAEADGTALHIERRTLDMKTTGVVAVTLENEAGVDQPTTTPLIVASLALQ